MERTFLRIIVLIAILFLNACSASAEVSQESIQTAIAETQQVNDLISTVVATTVNSFPSETPLADIPVSPPGYDYSSWKEYSSPDGYFFKYPTRFNLDVRQNGEDDFIVLVAEGSPPNEVSFSVSKVLAQGNLEEIKVGIDLDNPVYNDLSSYGMTGFIIEGTVPGEGFGSGSVVYKAYFELGNLLITLDCPWNFCDRQEFDLILRSFKLN